MKILVKGVLFALLIQMFAFQGFGQTDSMKVGFILANLFVERWQKDKIYFEERMHELGANVVFKDCYDQPENQLAAAVELVEQKVDAMVIIAVDAVAAAPIVTICKEAHIPLLAYDRLILDAPLEYYITFNSIQAGELMAAAVVDRLPKGKILYLGGPPDDHNSVLIRQGVFNVLDKQKRHYEVTSTQVISWTELDAYLTINDVLANDKAIPDAIICAADVLTRGALAVMDEQNTLGKVLLTGQDAELDICRSITRDEVLVTIYKPGKELAYRAAEVVVSIVKSTYTPPEETLFNGMVKVPAILLQPSPVTQESLGSTVISDGYYSVDQVYSRKPK